MLLLFLPVPLTQASDMDLAVFEDKPINECANNIPCSRLSRWQCIAKACAAEGDSRPTDCYAQFDADKAKADQAICQAKRLSSIENIQAAANAISGAKIDDVVMGLMMVKAIEGDGAACREGIKDYVGQYGSLWTAFWVKAMSGCRILSQERSRLEEEDDLHVWSQVPLGQNKCSDIKDVDMQSMCISGATIF